MLPNDATRATTPALSSVAPGLHGLRDVFVNLYYAAPADRPQGPWVLIDAGLPGSAGKIRAHAEELFGVATPPAAILLTHGHFDHVGGLQGLLTAWPQVPVYAHPLELPYLTGRSAYPAPDPTVGGGLMSALSFTYPRRPYDFGSRVLPLPADGTVPGLPGWRWLPTPGHTFGHVSFFREADKVLVAGDAFTTVFAESARATYSQKQEVHGPPAYFTPDWDAARASVELLSHLQPAVAATGHGIPMHGDELHRQLRDFAAQFEERARPKTGRYIHQPATADASGVRSVPPPVGRPWLAGLAVTGLALGVLALAAARNGTGKKQRNAGSGAKRGKKSSADGSYRAWYRDNPAQYQASAHATYQPHSSQPPVDQLRPEHRYSDQSSRKIETQYP